VVVEDLNYSLKLYSRSGSVNVKISVVVAKKWSLIVCNICSTS